MNQNWGSERLSELLILPHRISVFIAKFYVKQNVAFAYNGTLFSLTKGDNAIDG